MEGRYVIDTSAWIEYLRGSEKGRRVSDYLGEGSCITPTIVIAELSDKYHREDWKHFRRDLEFIEASTIIKGLDRNIAVASGKIKNELKDRGFGLADAMILATAREEGARLVTGDTHFKGLGNTVFLD